MNTKTLALALTAAVLATQLVATSASAGERRANDNPFDSVEVLTLKVPTNDLDPTTVRGAKALHHRIVLAAERICMATLDRRNGLLAKRVIARAAQCFDAAVGAAVAEMRAATNVDIEQLAGVDRHADPRLSAVR